MNMSQSQSPPTRRANHFSLSGGGIQVDYATTSINGTPRMTYHDSVRTLSFSGADIRIVEVPDLGSIASVTLSITVDVGSTSFSVLIPAVFVSPGNTVSIATEGVTAIHRTPFAPQLPGQRDVYRVRRLVGSADQLDF
jgi:hypothetical protein